MPSTSDVTIPPVKKHWHPLAKAMYESLKAPELSQFMLGSDWAYAQDAAETLTLGYASESAEVLKLADRKWSALMLTEAARRRAGIEVERPKTEQAPPESVSDHRARLTVVSA